MTKGEQARLMAWRLRVLQHAAHEQNVARAVSSLRRTVSASRTVKTTPGYPALM